MGGTGSWIDFVPDLACVVSVFLSSALDEKVNDTTVWKSFLRNMVVKSSFVPLYFLQQMYLFHISRPKGVKRYKTKSQATIRALK